MKPSLMPPPWPAAPGLLGPLVGWFQGARRALPWRAEDLDSRHPDPYAVLVSELMLQQTQVATVIPYFQRWLRHFPDVLSLAAASEEAVHKQWEGLGYYRRARHLQEAAKAIAGRGWPDDLDGLLRLPGLGPYSAAAVAAIAFQRPEPALDGNALRVLARLLALETPAALQPALRDWLRPALARLGASRITQAIMELGALVCLPKHPRCDTCPLAGACAARALGVIDTCPAPRKRAAPKEVAIVLVAFACGDAWLLERPQGKGLLAGLWRWPAITLHPTVAKAAETPAAFGITEATTLPGWVQVYTHRREQILPCLIRTEVPFEAGPGRVWVQADSLQQVPMGNRDKRLRALLSAPAQPALTALPLAEILAELRS